MRRVRAQWAAVIAVLVTAGSAVRMHDESQGQAAERVPPGQPQAALYATMGFWDDSLAFLEDTIVACYNADQTSFAKCIRKEIAHAWDDSSYNVT